METRTMPEVDFLHYEILMVRGRVPQLRRERAGSRWHSCAVPQDGGTAHEELQAQRRLLALSAAGEEHPHTRPRHMRQ